MKTSFLDDVDKYVNGVIGGHYDNVKSVFDTPESWINFSTEDASIPMVMYIFDNIGIHHNFALDIGAYSSMASNVYPIMKRYNIDGLLLDGENKHKDPLVKTEWLERDNICRTLELYNCPKNIDYISIDIDNMDYWILKEIMSGGYTSNVLVLEFNPIFMYNESYTKKYDSTAKKDGTSNYGASLYAFCKLLDPYGYRLFAVPFPTGRNAYFIKKEYDYFDNFVDTDEVIKHLHPPSFVEGYKTNFSKDIEEVRLKLKDIFVKV